MIAEGVAAVSAIGLMQSMAGLVAVRRFVGQRASAQATVASGVTVLKPLYGDEPLLETALASVCRQQYPAWQVVFGVHDPADTALPVVRRLQRRFPDCDIAVVVDPTSHGANGKVANLMNMLPAAKHDVLVISDSDVHVAPDWLQRLAAALEPPEVGLATTLYTGLPAGQATPGILGAAQINHYFLPGVLLARAMGRQDCLGATMVLRRETLERVGGFASLVNHLADDNVLGRLVQRLGLNVALAGTVPATTIPEATFRSLWQHELRWARTIRALASVPFAASLLQYPIAWGMLAVPLAGGAPWSLGWLLLAVWIRALIARGVDRALELANPTALWLLPVRELMSVAVMVASYAGRGVVWRGHTMQAEGFDPR
jgi:ceramide glucosyltransferase